MNYELVYKRICEKGKNRVKNKNVYLEKHHIIPVFFFKNNKRKLRHNDGIFEGDGNHKENICYLTPKEHFIVHILLCKIWKNTKWYYKCASSLIFFFNKNSTEHIRNKSFNACNSRKYEKFAILAKNAISNERKGKMPVKDLKTGKMIGSVNVDHPNVLNGIWVHHTKNMKHSKDAIKNISNAVKHEKNPMYVYSDKEIIDSYIECCKNNKLIVNINFWIKYSKKYNKPYLTSFKKFRFDGTGFKYLINYALKYTNLNLPKGDRPFHGKQYKKFLRSYKWQ